MPFKMGEDHPVGIVLRMAADDHLIEPRPACHWPFHFALFIHQVKLRNCSEAMIFGNLFMHGRAGAGTSISCVAFHDRAIHFLYQSTNQLWAQIITCRRFAGRDLDRNISFRCPAESLIDLYQTFLRNIGGKINNRCMQSRIFRRRRIRIDLLRFAYLYFRRRNRFSIALWFFLWHGIPCFRAAFGACSQQNAGCKAHRQCQKYLLHFLQTSSRMLRFSFMRRAL